MKYQNGQRKLRIPKYSVISTVKSEEKWRIRGKFDNNWKLGNSYFSPDSYHVAIDIQKFR